MERFNQFFNTWRLIRFAILLIVLIIIIYFDR
jgi:hypothetical protein